MPLDDKPWIPGTGPYPQLVDKLLETVALHYGSRDWRAGEVRTAALILLAGTIAWPGVGDADAIIDRTTVLLRMLVKAGNGDV